MSIRSFVILVGISLLIGCSNPPNAGQVVDNAIAAIGGQERLEAVTSIVRRGSGTGAMVGQVPTPDEAPPSAELTTYTEALDFVDRRALVEYDLKFGAFEQHRREVLTDYGTGADAKPVGYQMANGRGSVASPNALYSFAAPFHTPELALLRDPITVLFRASEETENTTRVAFESEFNGIPCFRFQIDLMGHSAQLYFNPETSLLVGYELSETDPFLGDVPTAYVFDDYRDVDGLLLPHEMWVRKDGLEVSHMRYDSIQINQDLPEADYAIPEEMAEDAAIASEEEFVPIELNRLSAGVFHAVGFSHNSLIVEFPNYLVVVEAPWNESQSKVLVDAIRDEFPLKPIRYVVVTHPHPDHIGGLRRFVATGTTILVEQRHVETVQKFIDARHGYTPDELHTVANTPGRSDNIGTIESFAVEYELSEGSRTLTLHALEGSQHVIPMVVAYLPQQRILFQSDLYTAGVPAATPEVINLFESITNLGLEVDTIVGGHGGAGEFEELSAVVEGS